MAIYLNTTVKQNVLMYSSQLPDLAFTTDNDVLAISICDRKDFTELYCSSIYTYNGKILL